MITMFLLILQGWQRKVSVILTRMFRKQEIVVLLYVVPLLVIMSLTSQPRKETDDLSSIGLSNRPIADEFVQDSEIDTIADESAQYSNLPVIIVTGANNISQPEYFNRPNKTWELDLVYGTNDGVPLKSILFYNGIYYYPDFAFGKGRQPFIDAKCKVDTCMVTDDSYLFDTMGKSLHKSLNFSHNVMK